jgi:hypothetical protein
MISKYGQSSRSFTNLLNEIEEEEKLVASGSESKSKNFYKVSTIKEVDKIK